MMRKFVVGGIAAGALAVSLAGVAGAAPNDDSTPGNLGDAPGTQVGTIVHDYVSPGTTTITDLARSSGYNSIGDSIKTFSPGQRR